MVGQVPAAVRFVGPSGAFTALRSKVAADRWSQPLTIGDPVGEWLAAGGAAKFTRVDDDRVNDVRTISTNADLRYLTWRFATPLLGYRVVHDGENAVIVRARCRGKASELAVVARYGAARDADRLAARAAKHAGADYAIRVGAPSAASGWLPLPGGGPVLTWRNINDQGLPPLANWNLELGDVELF